MLVQVQFEARVTKLHEKMPAVLGCVTSVSSSGLSINLPFPLGRGDHLHVELADSMLYAHVIDSNWDFDHFRANVEIDQVLLGTSGLADILQTALLEALPDATGLEQPEVYLN